MRVWPVLIAIPFGEVDIFKRGRDIIGDIDDKL